MCPAPRTPVPMPKHDQLPSSFLLELAAADDLLAFRRAVQEDNLSLVAAASWYGPSSKSKGPLALQLRTPTMVAALYGSTQVLSYILSIAPSEAARAAATDGATPLQLAAAGRAATALAATHLLLAAGASSQKDLLTLTAAAAEDKPTNPIGRLLKGKSPSWKEEDINGGVFGTDEFRMYSFKVKPCSRAYTHDWTECPFAHPAENARRRDPRRFSYTCVPCPEFRKAPDSCRKGDACEYAHGVFESWLHPAQYRTRLCKDERGCPRRICFFAHGHRELRTVNPSDVSVAMPTPPSGLDVMPRVLRASLSSREMDFEIDQYMYRRHKLLLSSLAAPARSAPDYSDLVHYASQLQAQHKPPLSRPMGSRASAFANRSQSFVERAPGARSLSLLSGWGSPDGKLDWGVQGAELHKEASWVKDGSDMLMAARWSDLEQMVA